MTITISEQTYWICVLLFGIGLLVAPSLTLYLLSWEMFGKWYASSVVSAILILAAVTIILTIIL